VAATPLVTVAYLLALPGFGGQSSVTLEPLIEQASGLVIDHAAPYLDDADATTCPSTVATVISAMIRRGLGNPRGAQSETLGDYTYSMGSDGGVPTLYMTRREERKVRKAVGRLGAGTLAMEGYLPVQRSELTGVSVRSVDAWDAVAAE
jgi:hypothetical protein